MTLSHGLDQPLEPTVLFVVVQKIQSSRCFATTVTKVITRIA